MTLSFFPVFLLAVELPQDVQKGIVVRSPSMGVRRDDDLLGPRVPDVPQEELSGLGSSSSSRETLPPA